MMIRFTGTLEDAPRCIQDRIRKQTGAHIPIQPGDIHSGVIHVEGPFDEGATCYWTYDATWPQMNRPYKIYLPAETPENATDLAEWRVRQAWRRL
jgi:hypothetical protein